MDNQEIIKRDFTVFNARAAILNSALLYTILENQSEIIQLITKESRSTISGKINKRLQKKFDAMLKYYDDVIPTIEELRPPLMDK